MKNVTVSIDDETHRAARMAAAERGISLSALVRDCLNSLRPAADPRRDAAQQAVTAMNAVKKFSAADRISREKLHDR